MLNQNLLLPKRSPFGLIQEDIWPNEWLMLIACMMLNCTSRKQVDKILPQFINNWSEPEEFLRADYNEVVQLCRPLGFANRRTKNMFDMTNMYLMKNWTHVNQLPGIGEYASRSWELFFKGIVGTTEPTDGALSIYWRWLQYEKKEIF